MKHEDEDEEECEESDAINYEDEIQEDKERDKKKAKSEHSALKDYLGEKVSKVHPENLENIILNSRLPNKYLRVNQLH